jgi:hypothetical protein
MQAEDANLLDFALLDVDRRVKALRGILEEGYDECV